MRIRGVQGCPCSVEIKGDTSDSLLRRGEDPVLHYRLAMRPLLDPRPIQIGVAGCRRLLPMTTGRRLLAAGPCEHPGGSSRTSPGLGPQTADEVQNLSPVGPWRSYEYMGNDILDTPCLR